MQYAQQVSRIPTQIMADRNKVSLEKD